MKRLIKKLLCFLPVFAMISCNSGSNGDTNGAKATDSTSLKSISTISATNATLGLLIADVTTPTPEYRDSLESIPVGLFGLKRILVTNTISTNVFNLQVSSSPLPKSVSFNNRTTCVFNSSTKALAPNASCIIFLQYLPETKGEKSTFNINVLGNDKANNNYISNTKTIPYSSRISSAIVTTGQPVVTGMVGGTGAADSPYQVQVGSSAPTITYTITSSGQLPLTNFQVNLPANSLLPWGVAQNNCGSSTSPIKLNKGGNCNIKFTLNPAKAETVSLPLASAISLSWKDADVPSGQTQPFGSSDVSSVVYAAPSIQFSPESVALNPNSSTTVTATLVGRYGITDQTIAMDISKSSGAISMVTSKPSPCVLNSANPQCTFTLTASADVADGKYNIPITNSGNIAMTQASITATVLQYAGWTWTAGNKSPNQLAKYGTLGVAASSNHPGSRANSTTWTDNEGRLWLFGGTGYNDTGSKGVLSDLWMYDPKTKLWTWVNGTKNVNQVAIYGTKKIPSATNNPGARSGNVSWIDSNNNLWLFGGDSAGSIYFNDLWKYTPATNQWTWVSGSNVQAVGNYGTKGVAAANNVPGSRTEAGGRNWVDSSGNLWLIGGWGFLNNLMGRAFLNDLWKYNPTTDTWTWMNGAGADSPAGGSPNYGTKGVAGVNNTPTGLRQVVSWKDQNGNFWLFGGRVNNQQFNNLWKYNVSTNQWTWMGGPGGYTNLAGIYGIKGTSNAINYPGSRTFSAIWADKNGNLWIFGGNGFANNNTTLGSLNDLWKYNISSNQWTWMTGESTINKAGNYGTINVTLPQNTPGATETPLSWEYNNTLWMFGGGGYITTTTTGMLSDLWKYHP